MPLQSTWSGSEESGYFENANGFYLEKNESGVWELGSNNLDDEGIEFYLSLLDLFLNPVLKLALVNPETGKLYIDLIPNVADKTIRVSSFQEMLALNPSEITVGDVCVIRNKTIPGGVSFRLAFPDVSNFESWVELVSRYANWNDIQGKPPFYPPYKPGEDVLIPSMKHTHTEHPILDEDGKLPTKYIRVIPVGNRFRVDTIQEMLQLTALKSDVCSVKAKGKRYQLYGLASKIEDWEELDDPEGYVTTINGQSGVVFLTPEDIGALSENATPDDIGAAPKEHFHKSVQVENEDFELKFQFDGTNLFYTLNGGSPRPFA